MDIEKILEEVRALLLQMDQTGESAGLLFFNVLNKDGCAKSAELQTRNGKLARLIITSAEQMRIDEAGRDTLAKIYGSDR